MRKIKELTPQESLDTVRGLLKRKRKIGQLSRSNLKPGHLIFSEYNAKDKENTYDRTPLVLILRINKKHTLGLNFHWIPFSMRVNLVKRIIDMNAVNIRNRKALQFNYGQLKPMLKSLGYAPCIRLYINNRFNRNGVVIPPYKLMEMARLKTETFTKGRYSAGQMYAMARAKGKKNAPSKRRSKI